MNLNNYKKIWYILKLGIKLYPLKIISGIISQILIQIKNYLMTVFIVGMIVNLLETNRPVTEIIMRLSIAILICVLCLIYDVLYNQYIYPICSERNSYRLSSLLNRKISNISLQEYENSEFYDLLNFVTENAANNMEEILNNLYILVGRVFSGVLLGITISVMDPWCIIFVLITVSLYYIVKNKSNRLRYKFKEDTIIPNRKKDYVKKVYTERSSVMDMRLTDINSVLKKIYNTAVGDNIKSISYYGKKISILRTVQNGAVTFFSFFSSVIYLITRIIYVTVNPIPT